MDVSFPRTYLVVAVEAAGILCLCPHRHPDHGVGDLLHLFDLWHKLEHDVIHTGDKMYWSLSVTHLLLRRGSLFRVTNCDVGHVVVRLILSANNVYKQTQSAHLDFIMYVCIFMFMILKTETPSSVLLQYILCPPEAAVTTLQLMETSFTPLKPLKRMMCTFVLMLYSDVNLQNMWPLIFPTQGCWGSRKRPRLLTRDNFLP